MKHQNIPPRIVVTSFLSNDCQWLTVNFRYNNQGRFFNLKVQPWAIVSEAISREHNRQFAQDNAVLIEQSILSNDQWSWAELRKNYQAWLTMLNEKYYEGDFHESQPTF